MPFCKRSASSGEEAPLPRHDGRPSGRRPHRLGRRYLHPGLPIQHHLSIHGADAGQARATLGRHQLHHLHFHIHRVINAHGRAEIECLGKYRSPPAPAGACPERRKSARPCKARVRYARQRGFWLQNAGKGGSDYDPPSARQSRQYPKTRSSWKYAGPPDRRSSKNRFWSSRNMIHHRLLWSDDGL